MDNTINKKAIFDRSGS